MRDLLSPARVWTPTRHQFQTTECGVGSLGMILAHYGRDVPLEEIRAATGVSRACCFVRGYADLKFELCTIQKGCH